TPTLPRNRATHYAARRYATSWTVTSMAPKRSCWRSCAGPRAVRRLPSNRTAGSTLRCYRLCRIIWNLPSPILAVLGCTLAVSIAYALGAVALRNRPAPLEITLAIGAVLESLLVFCALLTRSAHQGVFVALAILTAAIAWKFGRRVRRKPFPIPTAVL